MKKLHKKTVYLISFCLILLCIRFYIKGSISYIFLVWNLFLAIIPLLISHYLTTHKTNISKSILIPIIIIWLLFLPNSPYIMTDFIHFTRSDGATKWLDILLLFSFAFSSLVFGLISINQMLEIVQRKWSSLIANVFLFVICFGCGFGIYLGRVLRFNSWDALTSPLFILKKSLLSYSNTTAWFMTLGFGGFLYVAVKFYSLPSTKS